MDGNSGRIGSAEKFVEAYWDFVKASVSEAAEPLCREMAEGFHVTTSDIDEARKEVAEVGRTIQRIAAHASFHSMVACYVCAAQMPRADLDRLLDSLDTPPARDNPLAAEAVEEVFAVMAREIRAFRNALDGAG